MYQTVGGAELYYEVQGRGPAVLFIPGATGDGGHFAQVARHLASDFTVITYDRRGNSRSPRPAGWQQTSVAEQADDAAGLLTALGVGPAVVFGNSGGAIITLGLLVRHPEVVRAAMLHEPPLMSILDRPQEIMEMIRPVVEGGMARGGSRGAVEAFLRFAAGDANLAGLAPELRERMLGNGETLFGAEFGAFEFYQPDAAALAAISRPVQVLAGNGSPPFLAEVAARLAGRLGVRVTPAPGAHTPQFDHPAELADQIRTFARQVGLPAAERPPVLFVPGGVLPAAVSYGALLPVLGSEVQAVLKDLEVYAADAPPPGYGVQTEIDAITRAADSAGLETFHLVGYSGGGAMSLAFATRYPERVRSLALIEPAWIGNLDNGPVSRALWADLARAMQLPPAERVMEFVRVNSRPGVEPPPAPPGPPPAWMSKRPAGLMALVNAFRSTVLDPADVERFRRPVYLAVGGRSHPIEREKATVLAGLVPDLHLEVYPSRHHFDPPHRAEPHRFAQALRELWARANRQG